MRTNMTNSALTRLVAIASAPVRTLSSCAWITRISMQDAMQPIRWRRRKPSAGKQRSKTTMPSRSELRQYYEIGAQLAPAIHQHQDWPYEVPHSRYVAYMAPPHDVGGEADAPVRYEEKEEEEWELNTYVTCEVLGWRGVWNAEERRRRGNNDLGLSLYYGFPYYGRWIWAAARMLVDKNHVSLTELLEKIAEVRARYEKR
jgi:hypothetical protein